jgi:hypothetical protein
MHPTAPLRFRRRRQGRPPARIPSERQHHRRMPPGRRRDRLTSRGRAAQSAVIQPNRNEVAVVEAELRLSQLATRRLRGGRPCRACLGRGCPRMRRRRLVAKDIRSASPIAGWVVTPEPACHARGRGFGVVERGSRQIRRRRADTKRTHQKRHARRLRANTPLAGLSSQRRALRARPQPFHEPMPLEVTKALGVAESTVDRKRLGREAMSRRPCAYRCAYRLVSVGCGS